MIIQISGKMGSGKTALVNKLKPFLEEHGITVLYIKYADPLYEIHEKVLEVLKKYGVKRGPKDRQLLQILGTEYGRNCIHENIWALLTKNKAEEFLSQSSMLKERRVVLIDDCRFVNELRNFPEGFNIRLTCDDSIRASRAESWSNTPHPSELALDNYTNEFSLVVDTGLNNIDQMFEKVISNERILRIIRP